MPRTRFAAAIASLGVVACFATIDRSKIGGENGDDAGTSTSSSDAIAPAGDGGTPSLDCDGAALCDGFERDLLSGPWPNMDGDDVTTLALDTTRAHTGTRSLHVSSPGRDAGSGAGFFIAPRQPVARRTQLRYAVFVENDFVARAVNLAKIHFDYDGGAELDLYVEMNGAISDVSFNLREQAKTGATASYKSLGHLPLLRGRWVAIETTVDQAAVPTRVTLVYDDTVVLGDQAIQTRISPASPMVELGVTYMTSGPPLSFWFDDVRLDVVP